MSVSKLGFGCSGAWANQKIFPEKKAIDLIHQALDKGITHFDTGNFYAQGNAEKRLGKALTSCKTMEHRAALSITSKTGTQIGANGRLAKDFSRDTIFRDVETSLRRLGIDALDILYLHGPNEHELVSSLPVLCDLKREKLIHSTGVCTNDTIAAMAAAEPMVDVLMTSFNLWHRAALPAFTMAKENGKKTVAIAAMAQGLYRKGMLVPKSRPDLWYLARAVIKNRSKLAEAQRAAWLHDVPGWTAPELALAYTLSQQAIDIVMTTTTNPSHLETNVETAQRHLPDDLRDRLEAMS